MDQDTIPTLDPTIPLPLPGIDPTAVTGFAQIALLALRQAGKTDDEIRTHYLHADTADEAFEQAQERDRGVVFAPAAAVKARMRTLLVN